MKELGTLRGTDSGFAGLMDGSDWEGLTLRSFQGVFSGREPKACRNPKGSRYRTCEYYEVESRILEVMVSRGQAFAQGKTQVLCFLTEQGHSHQRVGGLVPRFVCDRVGQSDNNKSLAEQWTVGRSVEDTSR